MTRHGVRACLVGIVIVFNSIVAGQETRDIRDLDRTKQDLTLLANAAHLLPLSEKGHDEIRVWTENYMGGTARGYVIREDGIRLCKTRFYYNNKKERMEVRGMRCVRDFSQQRAEQAFALLDQVVSFNGKSIECGALDGWGAIMEGVRSHKVFVVEADNPDECKIPGTKEVMAFLDAVWQ